MAVHDLTAIELRDRIAAGQISSVEATRAILERPGQLNPVRRVTVRQLQRRRSWMGLSQADMRLRA